MTTPSVLEPEVEEIRELASRLRSAPDLDPLVERLAGARVVLLGEASHGTAEYYGWRATLTRRLIAEHGFSFVAVEGDWPDCFTVNRWVKGAGTEDGRSVLGRYERWPTWMWANEEVADFATWLRAHNRDSESAVGFYGLDVYSLWDSLHAVFDYLARDHPEAMDAARAATRCFEPYGEDPQAYASATAGLVPHSCRQEVIDLLTALRRSTRASSTRSEESDPEALLDVEQNAEVLSGAERYYRTMVRGDSQSWNVRDTHMTDTLDRLLRHHGPSAKAIVWEHNTHVGDARATDMAAAGMVNVGQLVRERYPGQSASVGFAGHRGSVIAADFWGAPARVMAVPPAVAGSHEDLLEAATHAPSVLVFPDDRESPWLSSRRGHRAIGVVYRSGADSRGNWVPTVIGRRYDALLSFPETHALEPLHRERPARTGEQETYPWAV